MSFLGVALKELAAVGAAAYSAWTANTAANDLAAAQNLQGPAITPEMVQAAPPPMSAAQRQAAYQRAILAFRKPWLPAPGTEQAARPLLFHKAATTFVQPRVTFANLPLAAAALRVIDPTAVKAPVLPVVSAKDIEKSFDVKAEAVLPGIVRLVPVMVGSVPEIKAVREAIAAGEAPALAAASTVVLQKLQATHAELSEAVPSLVVANTLPQAEQLAELQAVVQDPATSVRLLSHSRMIADMDAAAQTRLIETLTTAGLDPQGVYSSEDLIASMKELVRAAEIAGVEPLLVAELKARLARLSNLNDSVRTDNLGVAFARNYFHFYGDTMARITANSTSTERARVERQLALVNSLGMLALQAYLPRTAPRDVAFLVLANFVGLGDLVDRTPRPDANWIGMMGSDRVAPVGSSPQAGDDGRQDWN